MDAIVLTCDKYAIFTDHMIDCYMRHWPSNPFRFVVPYQQSTALDDKYGELVELVRTPSDIKGTMMTLLKRYDDEDWLYWCIDDKYLIELDEDKANDIYDFTISNREDHIVSISFCRARKLLLPSYNEITDTLHTTDGNVLIRRRNYPHPWIHHFVKAKWLRRLFESFPDRDFNAKEMDSFYSAGGGLVGREAAYVIKANIAVFGESTTRGKVTKNCLHSLEEKGYEIPSSFQVSEKEIIIGVMGAEHPTLSDRFAYEKLRLRKWMKNIRKKSQRLFES